MKDSSWKIIILILFVFSVENSLARNQYVIVGVSGFGTKKNDRGMRKSGIHDNLPEGEKVYSSHKFVHYDRLANVEAVLEPFKCHNGKQENQKLGLVILAHSWGNVLGSKLGQLYREQCGRDVDIYLMIDGVTKPIGAMKQAPQAALCLNYYQTSGVAHGMPLNNCSNVNLTNWCKTNELGAVECHTFLDRALAVEFKIFFENEYKGW